MIDAPGIEAAIEELEEERGRIDELLHHLRRAAEIIRGQAVEDGPAEVPAPAIPTEPEKAAPKPEAPKRKRQTYPEVMKETARQHAARGLKPAAIARELFASYPPPHPGPKTISAWIRRAAVVAESSPEKGTQGAAYPETMVTFARVKAAGGLGAAAIAQLIAASMPPPHPQVRTVSNWIRQPPPPPTPVESELVTDYGLSRAEASSAVCRWPNMAAAQIAAQRRRNGEA